MRAERNGYFGQGSLRLAALVLALGLALGLGGCGGSSSLFSKSPLDVFSTSSKATTGNATAANAAAGGAATANAVDPSSEIECPVADVRTGAATLMIGSKPGAGEPSALDLRYQGTITRLARECHVNAGVMTMKVGVEGRVITGPAGIPGTVDVPLRIAVVHEGPNPRTVVSRFVRIPVTVNNAVDRVTFNHVDPDIAFPLPQPLGDIDSYMVYVGFDALGAQPEKKKPVLKRKPAAKPAVKPKQG
jgi:hypothetical protein